MKLELHLKFPVSLAHLLIALVRCLDTRAVFHVGEAFYTESFGAGTVGT
jgi:hypothetical protein